MSFLVKSKTEDYVKCEVVDGGELKLACSFGWWLMAGAGLF
jgi:hypothetical protein